MDITISLVAVVLLLAANAFFVAAEFALVKARGFRIEALADQGSAAARLTMRIQHNLEAYLAACQLGITMASLGLGWVGEPTVAAMLEPLLSSADLPPQMVHTIAFLTGFLVFSSLHIVIGEQVPKTLAIRRPEPMSLAVAYPLRWSYLAVYPLNWLLNRASCSILRSFNVAEATHAEVLSGDELQGLVATSREHGELTHGKADMLHNLFEFDQRQVGRVMIPVSSMHALDLTAEPAANLKVMRETGHSRFPLIDGAKDNAIQGIVLVKDLHAAMLDGEPEPWTDLGRFAREPLIVPESQRVAELLDLMRVRRAHMAFVVDEYGALDGIVTLEDLLEEIVGEIHDETDDIGEKQDIKQAGENLWEADGLVSLSDLERVTGYAAPDALDANTLSGLFMQHLARMPEVGDRVEDGLFLMIVLSLDEQRVGRVSIEKRSISVRDPDDPEARKEK
ncbi:MAG: hemolysin family protein [Gammaproteobacteria bacterium]|nr:hemolysin family protein [Gammaproteobacteria bacterium]